MEISLPAGVAADSGEVVEEGMFDRAMWPRRARASRRTLRCRTPFLDSTRKLANMV
jgi:hypothetical protein